MNVIDGFDTSTFMKAGLPIMDEIKELEPKFYQFYVDDKNIDKITIQLSTIHGDPDLFVSKTHKYPDIHTPDVKRSSKCGIYPDIVIYEKTDNNSLVGNYYISVNSFEQSIYHLEYFTHST